MLRALASHQCGPGFISGPGVICELSSLVFVFAPRGFCLGSPVFFPPEKKKNIYISKLQINLARGPALKPARADKASSINIVIYLEKTS